MEEVQIFKCIIIGDGHTGKSDFVRRLASDFDDVKLLESENVLSIVFKADSGIIAIEIHDTSGQEVSGTLQDSFFRKAHCAIIFFDLSSTATFRNVFYWHRRIVSLCGKIPMALCGNRAHLKGKKLSRFEVERQWGTRIKYFELMPSSNITDPFKYLAQKLLLTETIGSFSKILTDMTLGIGSIHRLINKAVEMNSAVEA